MLLSKLLKRELAGDQPSIIVWADFLLKPFKDGLTVDRQPMDRLVESESTTKPPRALPFKVNSVGNGLLIITEAGKIGVEQSNSPEGKSSSGRQPKIESVEADSIPTLLQASIVRSPIP